MKSYNELFNERFGKSQQIDNTFVELWSSEGLKSGIDYLKQVGATKLDIENYNIGYNISQWTKNILSAEEKIELLNELKNFEDYVLDVNVGMNDKFKVPEVVIKTTEGEIRAIQFSAFIPQCKEIFPFIETDERIGKCYTFAKTISLNLGVSNEIVTGYVYGYSDKAEFLHSWVEITLKGEEYVIDGTINAMINKQGYYLMRRVKPLTRISNEQLISDANKYLYKIQTFPLEVYFVFRDEIINDLEKNQEIFKK